MENAPVLTISARTVPPEIEEHYNKWYGAAYGPIFIKLPGARGIDRYKIIKANYIMPNELGLYHNENLEAQKKRSSHADRTAVIRDSAITFHQIQRFWSNTYELMRSFRNDSLARETNENTVVDDAPIIHIEGYKIPESEYGNYEQWFNKWASQIYLPLILNIPGVKACNFFRLIDYKDPVLGDYRFVELDMPRFTSIIYLESLESMNNFNQSKEFGAFRGSLELGFPDSLKILWDTEYQLFASYRPPAKA